MANHSPGDEGGTQGRPSTVTLVMAVLAALALAYALAVALAWTVSDCHLQPTNLRRVVSVSEPEAPDKFGGSPKGHPDWEALKAQMLFLDQLWWYEDHGPLQGTDGYVLVRLGFPIACLPVIQY